MTPRRELTWATLGGAGAAGLALLAASRTWLVEPGVRPAPLPAVPLARSGASLAPALPALALVALAATVAVLATTGRARTVVASLVAAAGAAMVGVSVPALLANAGRVGGSLAWPAVTVAAGLIVAVAGLVSVRRGRGWPGMGARFGRNLIPAPGRDDNFDGHAGHDGQPSGRREAALWDAIDRGEDPTQR